ncbi:MAG: PQQ-binding-like beta-propeller repeat protein [Planctomycetes bacterium]|nr:PQQ-binding-like beta-propeller repeat protein [Planctomycetota bacterium]
MRNRAIVGVLVFASFALYSAFRSPVPGVNEPHYLAKAKHFWQPDWCRGDFFLESSNPHLVFYCTIGSLTNWFTLAQTAWIGRAVGLALLAAGWSRFLLKVLPSPRTVLWVTWLYMAVAACGNFSGEWIIGGIEAKVIAYGLDFLALALALEGRWTMAALCAGVAVSFHPVVGLWVSICVVLASGAVSMVRRLMRRRPAEQPAAGTAGDERVGPDRVFWPASLRQLVWVTGLFLVGSLPGLWPALRLLAAGDRDVQFEGNYIQVFYRLRHHLDPNVFHPAAYVGYTLLFAVWLALFALSWLAQRRRWPVRPQTLSARWQLSEEQRWFHRFVAATCVVALFGLLVGLGPPPSARTVYQSLRMTVLKLYPFRLFDAILPLGVCCLLGTLAERWSGISSHEKTSPGRGHLAAAPWFFFLAAWVFSLAMPAPDRNPSRLEPVQLADWLDVCRWVNDHTTSDALILTPPTAWAFKWYAERAEYVNFKDCPQDAPGIVEWNRRLRYLKRWGQKSYDDGGYSIDEVRELQRETGITHIVASRLGPFFFPPIYRNGSFRVYDLTERQRPSARVNSSGRQPKSKFEPKPSPTSESTSRRKSKPKPYDRITRHAPPKPLPDDAVTEDWPSFLGPRRDGVSRETRLLKQWPSEGPRLIWELEKGESFASPAICGDRLVYPHRVRREVFVECLHAETGELFWQFRFPTRYRDRYGYSGGPRASPVIDGDRVYIYGVEGKLFCLDLATGELRWKRDLLGEFDVPQDFFGMASTPLVDGDLLIVSVGAPEGPCVVGLDKRTGSLRWQAGEQWRPSYASPVAARLHGRRCVFVFAGGDSRPPTGGLICLDPSSGRIDFEFPWRSKSYESVNASTPVVFGDRVFVSASYRTGSALLKVTPQFDSQVVWTTQDVGFHFNTPIYRDGYLYGFDGRNEPDASLVCIEAKTGRVVWREVPEWRESVTVGGEQQELLLSTFRGWLLWADGHFLCLGELGHLLWLDLSPRGYRELSRCWLFAARETWTPPVVSRGLLYVCQNRRDFQSGRGPRLLCYDLRGR